MELSKYTQLYHLQRAVVMADQTLAPHGALLGHSMVDLDSTEPGPTEQTQLQSALNLLSG